MTSETQETNESRSSSTSNAGSPGKMQGWFKLIETIRKTTPQSNGPIKPTLNHNNNNLDKSLLFTSRPEILENSLSLSITNGHTSKSTEITTTVDSPTSILHSPSIISLPSTPGQIMEDISLIELESISMSELRRENIPLLELDSTTTTAASSPASTGSLDKYSKSSQSKIVLPQRSNRSQSRKIPPKMSNLCTLATEDISDDDIPLANIRGHKKKSIDSLSIPSIRDSFIPLATDLQSLPGLSQDDTRDTRFLNYADIETLSLHLNACLCIDKGSLSSPNPQCVYKGTDNVWNKILKLYYVKTFRKKLFSEKSSRKSNNQKQQPLSIISSPTTISFKTDWNVNRRNSTSTHRHTPKNCFHILQLKPKSRITISENPSSASVPTTPVQTFERMKDILVRTYYPHVHTAIEYGYQFGTKSKFPNAQHLVSTHSDFVNIKEMPESPNPLDDSTTITLKSPPSTTKRDSTVITSLPSASKAIPTEKTKPKIIQKSLLTKPRQQSQKGLTNDLSTFQIKESVVILTPAKTSLPIAPSPLSLVQKKNDTINRKRKSSISTGTNVVERKKKRIVTSPSLDPIPQIENISESESDNDTLPSQLPKQHVIKNGLQSHYYKTIITANSKLITVKSRVERRGRHSSGSLPNFYTGIFESDDDNRSYINYQLPYDIFWLSKQCIETETKSSDPSSALNPSVPTFQHQKKKSNKPQQKQPLPYKRINRNMYTDQLRHGLLSSSHAEKTHACECKPPGTCEDGTCLNRMMFTECLQDCACGIKCTNQKIRKGQWSKYLEVYDTSKYGQGVRATAPIAKGTFVCEYVGEIITEEQFLERMTNRYSKDVHHYTMKLTQNLVIDAYRMGSIARFANHSCSPNCEFQKWTVDGLPRMCMFTLRSIKMGEELTYDYNFQCFNLQAQQPCYCESPKCRGSIGTKQQTSTTTSTASNNNTSIPVQKITQKEKRMILKSSIFLLRNLKRRRERQQTIEKNNVKLKQSIDKKSSLSLFFSQNHYHSNTTANKSTIASLRKAPKLAHKDIFNLFYNHIRRSHFVKCGQNYHELIDDTCYYAQLAQLTIILNEIFESIAGYKCVNRDNDVNPSSVLKKCPSIRLFPAYYDIITEPIDLNRIRIKLDNGEYSSFNVFEKDLLLLFSNAIKYCGTDSKEASAVIELQEYYMNTLRVEYKNKLNIFANISDNGWCPANLHTLEDFIARLHKKEVIHGQIREILYDIIYEIDDHNDDDSPIAYKIVHANNVNSHRTLRSRTSSVCIVHCRCGSVYDENSLVQCHGCQLWQHVACVSITDPSRPYYCFECRPKCELNPMECLKTNVTIPASLAPLQTHDDNHCSFSTLTRSDGFVVRINESYFVPKQDEKNIDRSLTSPEYDILFVERLWIDDFGTEQASGFYYIRPNETFHEPNRKFFPYEVFRFPSSNDPLPISSLVRPCFVLDMGTYCKGKPISDNSTRVLPSDLFICEYRVDKLARTFTRLPKSRHYGINTKSYCFDNYVEKRTVKRDYQPYLKDNQQHHQDGRRRFTNTTTKSANSEPKDKSSRINGIVEKIYCCSHDRNLIPNDTKYTVDQIVEGSSTAPIIIDDNNHCHQVDNQSDSYSKRKLSAVSSISSPVQNSAGHIDKKRRTISLSSDDGIVELRPETDKPKLSKRTCTKPNDC